MLTRKQIQKSSALAESNMVDEIIINIHENPDNWYEVYESGFGANLNTIHYIATDLHGNEIRILYPFSFMGACKFIRNGSSVLYVENRSNRKKLKKAAKLWLKDQNYKEAVKEYNRKMADCVSCIEVLSSNNQNV